MPSLSRPSANLETNERAAAFIGSQAPELAMLPERSRTRMRFTSRREAVPSAVTLMVLKPASRKK